MLVAATHLSDQPNDKVQLEAVLDALDESIGKVEKASADAGYFSKHNIKIAEDRNIEPYIATGRQPHNQWLDEQLNKATQTVDLPKDATPEERMAHRLRTHQGKEIYRQRKMTVEPVFGIIKEVMGFRRFSLRGQEQVRCEWELVCMSYNLKRLFNLKTQRDKSAQTTQNTAKQQEKAKNETSKATFLRQLAQIISERLQRGMDKRLYSGSYRLYLTPRSY